jgi:hypothetical protein
MNTLVTSLTHQQDSYSSAFRTALSSEALRERVPAAFAPGAHERMSPAYTFLSTERVLAALASAGFQPVEARQACRAKSPAHARHLIRLRRRVETVQLRDAIPELSRACDNSGYHQRPVMCRNLHFTREKGRERRDY